MPLFNRRDFLAGLVSSPARPHWAKPQTGLGSPGKLRVIVGVNWEYNDAVNYRVRLRRGVGPEMMIASVDANAGLKRISEPRASSRRK